MRFYRGLTLLLLDRREEGLSDLRALQAQDPYAILWVACLTGEPQNLRRLQAADPWLRQLARLSAGDATPEEVLAGTQDAGQRCEAHGYAGLLAERRGDLAGEHLPGHRL